jgi:predicted MPP superfamily phosphohydrolase
MRLLRTATLAAAGLGAYAFVEPYLYRLSEKEVPLHAAVAGLSILHVSDIHMKGRSRLLVSFLEDLPEALARPPDLILATGDLIEDDGGIDLVLRGLSRIPARLGRFYVLGSHDYYQAAFKAYTKYFDSSGEAVEAMPADTPRLERGLRDDGWISLTNRSHVLESPHGRIRLSGIDDPFIKRDDTAHIKRSADESLAIGLMHAPNVVSEWFLAGYDLVVAGHTHGGQVRIPLFGALVTNCTLPRELAGGLHRIGSGWLHVSPGLGTGKYSPIRFACRPEVTLLRLVSGDGDDESMRGTRPARTRAAGG